MFKFMDLFNPCTRASYSAVLFVHSNSSLKEKKCRLSFGSMRMHPGPNYSCDLDPSKYKVQIGEKKLSFSLFLLLYFFPPTCSVVSNTSP
jgi:hypothetical protein